MRKTFALLAATAALAAGPAAAIDRNPSYLDPKYGEGCWVRFFEDANFERPLGRIGRSTYINSLAAPGLIGEMQIPEFFQRASSLVVGPEARLIGYAEPGFRKEVLNFEARREVPDLQAVGFPERVASLKIDCEKAPAR
jgi:hypothetical protein